jgi:hypothetical protein
MGRAALPARLAAALLIALAGLRAAPAPAQQLPAPNQGLVEFDGSLGPAGGVGGDLDPLGQWADYLITPEMGEQRGGNLFFSFRRFGIASGETATFTGPDPIDGPQSVSNVISGVTGGDPRDNSYGQATPPLLSALFPMAALSVAAVPATAQPGGIPGASGTLFVTERTLNTVTAFDAATGSVLWTSPTGVSPTGVTKPHGTGGGVPPAGSSGGSRTRSCPLRGRSHLPLAQQPLSR